MLPLHSRLFLVLSLSLPLLACRAKTPEQCDVLVSGDSAGWITTCGCNAKQAGGLARRATLLSLIGSPPRRLFLDAGGSASGTQEYQLLKLQSLLEGLQEMGLATHNLGAPETQLSPSQIDRLAQETGVQWLSSNLEAKGHHLNLKRKLLVSLHGLKILIAGVVDPKLVKNKQWQARDPIHSILEVFESEDADLRIVLAYYDEGGLFRLAEALPEFDALIGGPTGQFMKPSMVGPVHVTSATNQGKFLAHLHAEKHDGDWSITQTQPIEVHSDLSESPSQLNIVKEFRARLKSHDFIASETGFPTLLHQPPTNASFAGSDTCLQCHPAEAAIWSASKHAHAWEPLIQSNAHFDPYCQQCHTTGYGQKGGFQHVADGTSRLHVGCESCHGPSQTHVDNPRIKTPQSAKDSCLPCHDRDNSPQFSPSYYWNLIRHGPKK